MSTRVCQQNVIVLKIVLVIKVILLGVYSVLMGSKFKNWTSQSY